MYIMVTLIPTFKQKREITQKGYILPYGWFVKRYILDVYRQKPTTEQFSNSTSRHAVKRTGVIMVTSTFKQAGKMGLCMLRA